jgi:hypothetical protein
VRPAGVSSTEDEHAHALQRAEIVAEWLSAALGWPAPVRADSGNGGHLLYRINLPNDGPSRMLVERVFRALASVYDDGAVKLDTGVGNAARIWKLYPSLAQKGDSMPERPHRRSQLLSVPDPLEVVTAEQLKMLCDELLGDSDSKAALGTSASTITSPKHITDAGQYLQEHGIAVATEKDRRGTGGGVTYVLEQCVWDPQHTDRSAWVTQFPSGSIGAGCKHNGCQGKRLADFRDAVEGTSWRDSDSKSALGNTTITITGDSGIRDVQSREFPLIGADGRNHSGADPRDRSTSTAGGSLTARGPKGEFPLLSVDQLKRVATIKPEVLVPGKIMKRTLTITYGDADTGKSYYAQHTCFDLAAAGVPVWYVAAEGFDGIYMRILAWLAKHPGQRLDDLRVIPVPVNIFKGGEKDILSAQARAQPDATMPQLIVLDTLHRCTAGARESDNSDMVCVADTAARWRGDFGATTWAIHHEGKSASQGMRGASCLRDDADSVQYVFRGGDYSVIECEKQKDGIPRFEPEAFTLESCSLDEWGYSGLRANVLTPVSSDHIIEARRLWSADQQRRQTGKNAPGGEDGGKALTGNLETVLAVFRELYAQHPDGVFKAMWRAACEDAGIKPGSFGWLSKTLADRGKVKMPDTTGRYYPG